MKNILIIGAGVAGKDVQREILLSPELKLKVVGFVDDSVDLKGKKINGLKVLGDGSKLEYLVNQYKVDEIIIAIPSAEGEKIAEYVHTCSAIRVPFQIVPRVKEIIEGKASLKTLRKVRIEDLLGRPVIKSDVRGLSKFFENKRVLVTGAAGSIGSELANQIAAYSPKKLIMFDWWENGIFKLKNDIEELYDEDTKYVIGNIQDKKKVNAVFKKYKPDYVYHAAAYKHVPLMEENVIEAIKNNVFGTENLVKAAQRQEVKKYVNVSTDKAANPHSVMGVTKLFTEAIVSSSKGKTECISVRFGNVLGSNGSVVPIFQRQIEEGGPVKVTDKRMTRYYMTIPEAVQLILKAGTIGEDGDLFVLDMGKPVKTLDLAENMIRLSGYTPYKDIKIVFTGARPGEKIHEVLFSKNEKLETTSMQKIFLSKSRGFDYSKVPALLKKLKLITGKELSVETEVLQLFYDLLPSFKRKK